MPVLAKDNLINLQEIIAEYYVPALCESDGDAESHRHTLESALFHMVRSLRKVAYSSRSRQLFNAQLQLIRKL